MKTSTLKLKYQLFCLLVSIVFLCTPATAWAQFTIRAQTAVDITLTGFDSLKDLTIFQGEIAKGDLRQIDTPYRGLALLVFAGGQSYPLVIGDKVFTLKITTPEEPPSFSGSGENDFFYRSLAGSQPAPNEEYPFVDLLLNARNLLESTYTINTMAQLSAKKKELNTFVARNYSDLAHSDMIRRLMAQSFMMHEYVGYQVEGEAASAIQQRYQEAVLDGVGGWLKTLSPYLPGSKIVNACVALYYDRSMVAMASLIIDRFPDEAICTGESGGSFRLADDLTITDAQGTWQKKLSDLKGEQTVALVSDDCPVSMVAAVVKARELANRKAAIPLVVAPLQELSDTHIAMARMIRDEKILFINDEKWQRRKPATWPKLPFLFEPRRR